MGAAEPADAHAIVGVMNHIKAFVGHSFSPKDQSLVRVFLDYFSKIQNLNIGFYWEHAEGAEARELAQKVLSLMEGKDLFIGICTHKELCVEPTVLQTLTIMERLFGFENKLQAKTSDWITQEIGAAIGKNMRVLILLENGVRRPGGLQGDLEYIEFEREHPEKSFSKILEMVQSLIGNIGRTTVDEKDEIPIGKPSDDEPSETPDQRLSMEHDWEVPNSNWTVADYKFAYFRMVLSDNINGIIKLDESFLKNNENNKIQDEVSWSAYKELTQIQYSKNGNLTVLEQLAKQNPHNSDVHNYLAMAYQYYGEHEKAAHSYELSAEMSNNEHKKLETYGQAAISFSRAKHKKECDRIISHMKQLSAKIENSEEQLIRPLRVIAEQEGNDDLYMGLTEKLIGIIPDDVDIHFSSAYRYSERGEEALALTHYLSIPARKRTAMAWNNLGVQYETFELHAKSIEAFRNAESLDETLAMSNLANRLLETGFLPEADEIVKNALKKDDYHKNVGHTLNRIKGLPDLEDKKLAQILDDILPIKQFYRLYGDALLDTDITEYQGKWKGTSCDFNVLITNHRLLAKGFVKRTKSLLLIPDGNNQTEEYVLRYEGAVTGRAINGVFIDESVEKLTKTSSILTGGVQGIKFLMIVSKTFDEIKVLLKNKDKPKVYTLTPVLQTEIVNP